MGFLQTLLGGAMGFLTGGPIGAGVGLLAGSQGDGQPGSSGASGRQLIDPNATALSDYLQRQAYFRGFQSIAQPMMQQQAGNPQAGGSPRSGYLAGGRGRADQQAGGHQFPSTQNNNPSTGQLYNEFVAGGLAGVGGVQGNLDAAFGRGRDTINRQAQSSQSSLMTALARRGLLHSGVTATGLAGVEQGRLGSLSNLLGQQATAQVASAQQAQQLAAQLYSQEGQQGRAIQAGQPSFGDTLAGLAGAYAAYQGRPQGDPAAADPLTQRAIPPVQSNARTSLFGYGG